jgi:8-oxo-dGTP pyrophosphatase MutT (NUDIX family)
VPKLSHCSSCGAAFTTATWPRRCDACGDLHYRNPLPVAVLVVPVGRGVIAIRRAIPPIGQLALPGGFIDHGEDWRAAAARELYEETQIRIEADTVRELRVLSAGEGPLLVFGVAPPIDPAALPAFSPTDETLERVILDAPIELGFPLHTQVLREFFAGRRGL